MERMSSHHQRYHDSRRVSPHQPPPLPNYDNDPNDDFHHTHHPYSTSAFSPPLQPQPPPPSQHPPYYYHQDYPTPPQQQQQQQYSHHHNEPPPPSTAPISHRHHHHHQYHPTSVRSSATTISTIHDDNNINDASIFLRTVSTPLASNKPPPSTTSSSARQAQQQQPHISNNPSSDDLKRDDAIFVDVARILLTKIDDVNGDVSQLSPVMGSRVLRDMKEALNYRMDLLPSYPEVNESETMVLTRRAHEKMKDYSSVGGDSKEESSSDHFNVDDSPPPPNSNIYPTRTPLSAPPDVYYSPSMSSQNYESHHRGGGPHYSYPPPYSQQRPHSTSNTTPIPRHPPLPPLSYSGGRRRRGFNDHHHHHHPSGGVAPPSAPPAVIRKPLTIDTFASPRPPSPDIPPPSYHHHHDDYDHHYTSSPPRDSNVVYTSRSNMEDDDDYCSDVFEEEQPHHHSTSFTDAESTLITDDEHQHHHRQQQQQQHMTNSTEDDDDDTFLDDNDDEDDTTMSMALSVREKSQARLQLMKELHKVTDVLNSATEPQVKVMCELHLKKLRHDLERLNSDNNDESCMTTIYEGVIGGDVNTVSSKNNKQQAGNKKMTKNNKGGGDNTYEMNVIREHSEARQVLMSEMKSTTELLRITTKPDMKQDIENHLKKLQNDLELLNNSSLSKLKSPTNSNNNSNKRSSAVSGGLTDDDVILPKSPTSAAIVQQYKARQQLISEIQTATEVLMDSTKPEMRIMCERHLARLHDDLVKLNFTQEQQERQEEASVRHGGKNPWDDDNDNDNSQQKNEEEDDEKELIRQQYRSRQQLITQIQTATGIMMQSDDINVRNICRNHLKTLQVELQSLNKFHLDHPTATAVAAAATTSAEGGDVASSQRYHPFTSYSGGDDSSSLEFGKYLPHLPSQVGPPVAPTPPPLPPRPPSVIKNSSFLNRQTMTPSPLVVPPLQQPQQQKMMMSQQQQQQQQQQDVGNEDTKAMKDILDEINKIKNILREENSNTNQQQQPHQPQFIHFCEKRLDQLVRDYEYLSNRKRMNNNDNMNKDESNNRVLKTKMSGMSMDSSRLGNGSGGGGGVSKIASKNSLDTNNTENSKRIRVAAPANLPEGYAFDAKLGDRTFVAVVPKGGVKKGEIFYTTIDTKPSGGGGGGGINSRQGSSTDREDNKSNESTIVIGKWKDGFCHCLMDGIDHPMTLNGLFCPQIALAQIMTRMKLSWRGKPTTSSQSKQTFRIYLIITWLYLSINICLIAVPYHFFHNISFYYIFAIFLFNLLTFIILVFLVARTRIYVKSTYLIPASAGLCCYCNKDGCCGTCHELMVSAFCMCCTVTQMGRHTAEYETYRALCCSRTGLPDHVRLTRPPSYHLGKGDSFI